MSTTTAGNGARLWGQAGVGRLQLSERGLLARLLCASHSFLCLFNTFSLLQNVIFMDVVQAAAECPYRNNKSMARSFK